MTKDDLVGVWRERGREIVHADGTIEADVPRASQIMYTPDGYMAVVNAPSGRTRVNETAPRMDLDATSPQERAEAAIGVVAYAGRRRRSPLRRVRRAWWHPGPRARPSHSRGCARAAR